MRQFNHRPERTRGGARCGRRRSKGAGRARGKAEARKERSGELRERAGEDVAGTAHENFYDFYALAPAHLEIRFNSLNFKKLPLLSLAPSVDRGS